MMRNLFSSPSVELLAPVLRIVHRVIARFLLKQAGVKSTAADTARPLTLYQAARSSIQARFCSSAD